MKSVRITFLSLVALILWGDSVSQAAIRTVSNSSELQSALNAAVAEDEIVLKDGIYTGQFTIKGNSGTVSSPITVRAENRHKAILRGTDSCSGTTPIFNVFRNYWTIKDLLFEKTQRGIYMDGVTGVNINNNIIREFHADGIAVYNNATNNTVQNNVIAFGDACNYSYEDAGIYSYKSSYNRYLNNIIFATGDNGTQSGNKNGYGFVMTSEFFNGGDYSNNNLMQGNLLFMNGGKGIHRILNSSYNTVRDNGFFWGEGGHLGSDDCSDDYNTFINNIYYSAYHSTLSTKGNDTGSRGNHVWRHNLIVTTPFSSRGASFTPNSDVCGGTKYNLTLKDNILLSESSLGGVLQILAVQNQSTQFPGTSANHNLFWATSATSGWTQGYTYGPNDIHASGSRPQFVNAAGGDFTLSATSPGKGAASDGKDMGIEYNQYLKKSWIQNIFALSTQQKTGIAGTSWSFPVSSNHYYAVSFHVPDNSSCYLNPERFTFDDGTVNRDMSTNGVRAGNDMYWIQPSGLPSRWITLGRHKAADGTLNISWTRADCADGFVIRQIPTTDEAYSWISGASTVTPPTQPPPTASLAIPGRIEAESFNTGGEGVAYHDTTSANLEGAYRTSEAVDIKLAPGGVGYTIGYLDAGEWLKYDVNVTQSDNYTITLRGANGASTNGSLHIEVDGVNVTGTISIPLTGSYSTETTVTGPTVSLAQGTHTLRVYMEAANFDLNWIEFTSSSVGSVPAAPGGLLVGIQ